MRDMKSRTSLVAASAGALALVLGGGYGLSVVFTTEYHSGNDTDRVIPLPVLDKAEYNARMLSLAHYVAPVAASSTATSTVATSSLPFSTASTSVSVPGRLWPVARTYPQAGALLPFNRIVAYYGNFYSKAMGVLGEYPEDVLLDKLASTTALWALADPATPVLPAVQYIATVAQASPGKEGKYILRMPDDQIDYALTLANKVHGILILDVQVGQSTLEKELPLLEKYLSMPTVHLAIDPEFSMKYGDPPGRVIGTFDASDVNYAATYLASLVDRYHLPPKVLVVHRFTQPMLTHTGQIIPLPEVEVVIDMDGFGSKARKYNTYTYIVAPEPVQFTGIKLFYKNDIRPPADGLLSPQEVFKLTPAPIYIQYQ